MIPLHRIIAAALVLWSAAVPALNFEPAAGGPERAPVNDFVHGGSATYVAVSDRIYKTSDGGASWTELPGRPPAKARNLAIAGSTLFVATAEGVFKSADDGASWTLFNGSGDGALPVTAPDRVFASGSSVFAAALVGSGFNFTGALYRSDAASASWTTVTPAGTGSDSVTEMVTAGSNLCAVAGNSGIRYSSDGGTTWSAASGVSGQHAAIAVSPANGSVVYVATLSGSVRRSANGCQNFSARSSTGLSGTAGISVMSLGVDGAGAVYAGLADGRIFKSTDDAGAFTDNSSGEAVSGGASVVAFTPEGSAVLAGTAGQGALSNASGAWQHANDGLRGAAINAAVGGGAAERLLLGHAGGMLLTDDGGVSFSDQNEGLAKRRVRAVLRDGGTVLAGTDGLFQGPPGLFRSTDDGLTWTQVQTGLPAAGAGIDSLVAAGGAYYANVWQSDESSTRGVYKSTDGGQSWASVTVGLTSSSIRNLAARGSTVFIYIAQHGVYRTSDGGDTWEPASNGLGSNRLGKVYAASDVLVTSASNVVYRSVDDGATWTATTGFAVSRYGIELLSLAEDAQGVLYLGDEHAGLSVSTDGGATWTPDSDGLALSGTCIERINGLVVQDGVVYAGQGEGGGLAISALASAGGIGDSVECTTDQDIFPNAFSFTAQQNVAPGSDIQSNTVFISGLGSGVSVPIGVAGGEYSVGCDGSFTNLAGEIGNQSVCVRHRSAAVSEASVSTKLTVGDQSATFTSTTGLIYTGRDDEINTGYGTGGFASFPSVSAMANDMLVLPDGRTLLIGTGRGSSFNNVFTVAMLNADGTADTSFGTSGVVNLQIGTNDALTTVVRQPDGKLLLIGRTIDDNGTPQNGTDDLYLLAIARLDADGSLDTSYGTGGILKLDVNPTDKSRIELPGAARLLASGELIVAGAVTTTGQGERYFLVKLDAAGALVTGFGGNDPAFAAGIAAANVGTFGSSQLYALALQSDGKYVVAGYHTPNGQSPRGLVVRFNTNGTVDTAYGTNGIVVAATPGSVTALVTLAADKLLIAGGVTGSGPLIARYNGDGTPDTGFGTANGRTLRSDIPGGNFADAIVLSDGTIAAVGSMTSPNGNGSILLYARFDANGLPLDSFGPNGEGYVYRDLYNGNRVLGSTLAERPAGGVLIAGSIGGRMGATLYGGEGGAGPDTTPDPFSFTDVTGVQAGATITSNTVTIAGIDEPAAIIAHGGEYSIGCSNSFTSTAATIASGQTVCVRHTASASPATQTSTTLTVGGVSDTFTSTTADVDTTPAAFMFQDQTGAVRSAVIKSNAVTISGIAAPASVSVSGGEYSIGCGASFTAGAGMIANGQTVCVRHTTPADFEAVTNTVLTVGGVSDTFTSTTEARDVTPAAFAFADQQNVEPGTVVTSAPVTISGINDVADVAVSGPGSPQFSVGCTGTFTSAAATIANGQTLCVRHTAASQFQTEVSTAVVVGVVQDVFSSVTRAEVPPPDTTPNPFAFAGKTGVDPGITVVSASVTIGGIDAAVPVTVAGGHYSINGGAFTMQGGAVETGDQLRLRVTSGDFGETVTATLTVGGVGGSFTVVTRQSSGVGGNDVETLPDQTGQAATLETSSGVFEDLQSVPTPAGAPVDIDYPNGFFAFYIDGLDPMSPETVTVTLTLPADARPNVYVKCVDGSCSEYPYASFNQNVVTLTLTDNGAGDADPTPGRIRDPGAPAVKAVPPSEENGGGGGCTIGGVHRGVDPLLPLLAAIAGLVLLARRLQSPLR